MTLPCNLSRQMEQHSLRESIQFTTAQLFLYDAVMNRYSRSTLDALGYPCCSCVREPLNSKRSLQPKFSTVRCAFKMCKGRWMCLHSCAIRRPRCIRCIPVAAHHQGLQQPFDLLSSLEASFLTLRLAQDCPLHLLTVTTGFDGRSIMMYL